MKKSLVVLIVVIMVLSLVACGGNSTPSTSSKTNVQEKETPAPTAEEKKETAPAPAEKVKIVIWGLNPIAVGSGNKEMLDAFKASHDNIVLDPQTTPGSNGYATQDVTKLLASIAGGTPPDVTTLDRFTAAQFAARNALTPIDEYIEATKLDLNSYYKFAVDEITFNNKIWALPSDMGARLLYWNKDLFKKAG